MMLFSDTIIDFHLFYDRAVDIQIWALLTRSQCKVSVTQVIVKARGLLFLWASHISLYFFHLKLGNKIFLRPSSSSSRSFNIQPKFNRNSILQFQLIEISPYFLSTLHICEHGWRGIGVYLIRTFFWQFLHWLVNK